MRSSPIAPRPSATFRPLAQFRHFRHFAVGKVIVLFPQIGGNKPFHDLIVSKRVMFFSCWFQNQNANSPYHLEPVMS
jgi:hypothetical protein